MNSEEKDLLHSLSNTELNSESSQSNFSRKSFTRKLSSHKKPNLKARHSDKDILEDIVVNDLPMVPAIIVKCCDFIIENGGLQTEGIFRVSGSAARLKKLKDTFEINVDYEISSELYTVMDVSSLLKDYIRSLPEPLIPTELFQAFAAVTKIKNKRVQLENIVLLLSLLQIENRDTLEALLKFLTEVVKHNDVNKMGSHNLATIFAPCILKPPDSFQITKNTQVASIMEQNKAIIDCVTLFIAEVDSIFTISAELHNELIRKINATDSFTADILIKRKTVHYSYESVLSSPDKKLQINSSNDDLLGNDKRDELQKHIKATKVNNLKKVANKAIESGFES